jgi:uncharacterized membrane protein
MRAMKIFRATALTLVATLVTATAIYAADAQTGSDRARRWESRLQQKLGLTEDQVVALRQVYAGRDVNAHRQHFRALHAAQAEQGEVQNLLAQSMQMRLETLKQVGPILNPDQREAFAKMMERGHRGHHHRGQPQPQRG